VKVCRCVYNAVSGSFRIPDALGITYLHYCAGIDRDAENFDVALGLDQGGERPGIDLKLSPHLQDDYSECVVGGFKPQQIFETVEPERFDEAAFRATTDPYVDFAFGLDGTIHDEPLPSMVPELECPSALETLRHLESVIWPPTSSDTTADLIPIDLDATLLKPIPRHPSPGEWETRCGGPLNSNPLDLLPFKHSASSFSTLVLPAPSLSSATAVTTTPDRVSTNLDLCSLLDTVMPGTPLISATASVSGVSIGCAETASVLMNLGLAEGQEGVIAGPRLFQLLDDDGME
jgi:hypothetical protein